MPFRAFDDATATTMSRAFDGAWSDLVLSGAVTQIESGSAREMLASIIIRLVDEGCRDPAELQRIATARFKP